MTAPRRYAVVSPHLDDAAFSVGSLLLAEGSAVRVITVCAGSVRDRRAASDWDWRCGFQTAGQAAEVRQAEDHTACRSVGATTCHLGYLDAPYAPDRTAERLPWELQPLLADSTVWLPAGIGQHPDHIMARDAALAVLRQTGTAARLYADAPYASARGWHTKDHDRDPSFRWQPALDAVTAQGFTVSGSHYRRLDESLAVRKIALARHYASQLCGLGRHYPHLTRVDGDLATEVWWEAYPAATGPMPDLDRERLT